MSKIPLKVLKNSASVSLVFTINHWINTEKHFFSFSFALFFNFNMTAYLTQSNFYFLAQSKTDSLTSPLLTMLPVWQHIPFISQFAPVPVTRWLTFMVCVDYAMVCSRSTVCCRDAAKAFSEISESPITTEEVFFLEACSGIEEMFHLLAIFLMILIAESCNGR